MTKSFLICLLSTASIVSAAEYATDRGSKTLGGGISVSGSYYSQPYDSTRSYQSLSVGGSLYPDFGLFILPGLNIGCALSLGYGFGSGSVDTQSTASSSVSAGIAPRMRGYLGGKSGRTLPFAQLGFGYQTYWDVSGTGDNARNYGSQSLDVTGILGLVQLLHPDFGLELGVRVNLSHSNYSSHESWGTSSSHDDGLSGGVYFGFTSFFF